ncbi:MAG: DUF5642 family protein [Actinomycetota bacterium]|nr:DUF5642 family protein [Actinomycetota bacterium]
MRLFAPAVLALVCAACAPPAEPPAPSTTAQLTVVDPTRIDRARDLLPAGYEVVDHTGPAGPITVWGLDGDAPSQPPRCRELAAPAVDPASAHGWSASGPGGILYAVVAATASADVAPGPELLADCRHWTAASGHTSATVTAVSAPDIAAAETVGLATSTTTVVEGGTETRSQADTFIAHLGDHVCFVVLVTDPGSPYPALDAGFAAGLLVETVATLRG